jgi:type I restriction enzyme R subunit
VIIELRKNQAELFKQFSDNPAFKKWLSDNNFSATYNEASG